MSASAKIPGPRASIQEACPKNFLKTSGRPARQRLTLSGEFASTKINRESCQGLQATEAPRLQEFELQPSGVPQGLARFLRRHRVLQLVAGPGFAPLAHCRCELVGCLRGRKVADAFE
jgi:hypothetical protein